MHWNVKTDRGDTLTAAFLIMATGCSIPRMPSIPGFESFAGETYHTGLWPHAPVDFRGKRVGSSARARRPSRRCRSSPRRQRR